VIVPVPEIDPDVHELADPPAPVSVTFDDVVSDPPVTASVLIDDWSVVSVNVSDPLDWMVSEPPMTPPWMEGTELSSTMLDPEVEQIQPFSPPVPGTVPLDQLAAVA
jgi:hypothetical protein